MKRAVGLAGAAVLAGAAGLHVHWGLGGRQGAGAVIPTEAGRPVLDPGPGACFAVAALLATASTAYAAAATGARPAALWRTVAGTAAAVLAARAVGDGKHLGFTKTVKDTPFARTDTRLLAPLCAALAAAGLAAVTAP